MRYRPRLSSATVIFGLAAAVGCAGAGKTSPTGSGGTSSSGSAGTSGTGRAGTSGTGTAGTSATGTAGTSATGTAGTSATGTAGTSATGTAGTTPAAGGRGGMTSGSAGTTGAGGATAGTMGTGGGAGICQTAEFNFEPKIPTVYLVVDRSGSMFHCLSMSQNVCPTKSDTSWSQLKDAMETVMMSLDSQVRFGFTTIYGTNPAGGGSCPLATAGTLADNVAPAMNNAGAIKLVYDLLPWPLEADSSTTGKKFESPAMYAIRAATKALTAITAPGDKYIIFITDGQEDFCDDALEICASDSTVGALQAAFAANIKTIVFGLQTTQFNLPAGVLQAFANAGAGEPTVASLTSGLDNTAIFDQCQGVTPWKADLTASGHPTTRGPTAVVGTYATTAGPTMPFKPNASDQTMLVNQLSTAIAGVKSCSFDLTDVGGKSIKVDTTKLSSAHVLIMGTDVPLSATNGWNVDAATPTTLTLSGTACDKWRMPANKTIDFQFPCGTIIFE
jgi:hypothetical protein